MDSADRQYKYNAAAWFVGGLAVGLLLIVAVFRLQGWTIAGQDEWRSQQESLASLEAENRRLREARQEGDRPGNAAPAVTDLPYDEQADARGMVAAARREAMETGKFLMITFGANWCLDCRTLYRNLRSKDVAEYTEELFRFVSVNVGKFNRNRDLAEELGVDLSRGIPVAIFFDPDGRVIGTTNEGQLEPARLYSSKQILRFMRDIVERQQVLAPDSVSP